MSNKLGPESEAFNRLKGKRVRCIMRSSDDEDLVGILVWVDFHTVGIAIGTRELIVYKSAILSIESV
jgi:hypothetical protein